MRGARSHFRFAYYRWDPRFYSSSCNVPSLVVQGVGSLTLPVTAGANRYACWSLAAGANPNFIAKQMGHTDSQMIYRVYGSWMAENNQDQVSIINQKLSEFAPSMPHAVGSDVINQV